MQAVARGREPRNLDQLAQVLEGAAVKPSVGAQLEHFMQPQIDWC